MRGGRRTRAHLRVLAARPERIAAMPRLAEAVTEGERRRLQDAIGNAAISGTAARVRSV